MFENIIGQPAATGQLASDLAGGLLPGALLLEGPPASAKLSAALELARSLSCERGAAWDCQCEQCSRHRALIHQDLLVMGPKSFGAELRIGAAMLARAPGAASRYFFVRALRKLARRFDAELYAGEESKLAKALPLVRAVLESCDGLGPRGQVPDAEAAGAAAKLLSSCAKLEDLAPAAVPVFQVRAMERWARLAPLGAAKVVVIEHADTMPEAARNALLKLLEEPPPRAVFALTSSRPRAVIPTVLSRVRRYRFGQRSEADAKAVIERVFRDPGAAAPSVQAYVDGFRTARGQEIAEAAEAFARALVAARIARGARAGAAGETALEELAAGGVGLAEAIAAASEATSGFGSGDDSRSWVFGAFLDAAGSAFAAGLRRPGAGIETQRAAELFGRLARDARQRMESYNLQGQALVERLADSFIRARG